MDKELDRIIEETVRLGARVEAEVERQSLHALMNAVTVADEFNLCGKPSKRLADAPSLLYQHQKHGVRWLLALHRLGVRGGILADEMGLGKTVQVIAFFTALAKHGTFGTYLIVAPLSTLDNWRRELQRWAPWLHTEVFHGDHAARAKTRQRLRTRHRRAFLSQETLRERWLHGAPPAALAKDLGGVVLTSYEMVLADQGALARLLHWDATVVDEAQRLKRFDCRLLRMLNKAECGLRLILTGTPVQNTAEELWTLLEYIAPDRFTEADHTRLLLAHGADRAESAAESVITVALQKALQSFMLRRTKHAVGITLPPKLDLILSTPLTPLQRTFYERVQCADAYSSGHLIHLRKCCIHPFLFHEFSEGLAIDETWTEPALSSHHSAPAPVGDAARTAASRELAAFLAYSGKMQMLDRLLTGLQTTADKTADGAAHRVLLFSQMTKALDLVERYLQLKEAAVRESRVCGSVSVETEELACQFPYVRLDGASSAESRLASIAAFQQKEAFQEEECGEETAEEEEAPYRLGLGPRKRSRRTPPLGQYVEEGVAEDDCIFDGLVSSHPTVLPPSRPWQRPQLPQSIPRVPLAERRVNQLPRAQPSTSTANACARPYNVSGCHRSLPTQVAAPRPELPMASHDMSAPVRTSTTADAGPFLFLISTRAGGAGLNLTAADTVIMLDGDYNPQNDQQAVDRCHRIGQTRPVMVYRLVTPEAVEEAQLTVVMSKLALEHQLLAGQAPEAMPAGHKRQREEAVPAPAVEHAPRDALKPWFVSHTPDLGSCVKHRKQERPGALSLTPLMRMPSADEAAPFCMEKHALPDAVLARVLDRDHVHQRVLAEL